MSIEGKLDVIILLEGVNELLTYALTLESLILVYLLSMIMLVELNEVLSQELK